MYPPIHEKPAQITSFDRLDLLWDRYPRYHEKTTFATLDDLLEEHASYQKDFEDLREEYVKNGYDRFLVQLSWSDLAYRQATRELIEAAGPFAPNPFVDAFMAQFRDLDTDKKACFLFPESFVSQYFVIMEVCKKAEILRPVKSLFPDEEKVHYLAVFDKQDMDTVLLMFHLLYSGGSICRRKESYCVPPICRIRSPDTREISLITTILPKPSMCGAIYSICWTAGISARNWKCSCALQEISCLFSTGGTWIWSCMRKRTGSGPTGGWRGQRSARN